MPAPPDAFTGFIDALATALDDHEITAEDLAASMRLSRFHFDRLVAAAAGEPPARLRRRLLLERAAYRLLMTESAVLDVAVEAGYSSHEAFTRAFTRAYGAPPAAWRQRPTRIPLDSPSGVHFHPPGSIRLPGRELVSPMDLLTRMVEHHVWLVGEMLDRARRLTPEQLDHPVVISVEGIDDAPTVRSLLSRLVGQLDMWSSAMDNHDYDFAVEQHESLLHMKRRLDRVAPRFLEEVRAGCQEGRLGDAVLCPGGDRVEAYTLGGVVAHVLAFGAHRRTLVAGALCDAGITDLGAGDPMEWVAEPTRRQLPG